MNVIGIICEYNPFHNGHLYHIKKARELYPDSYLVLCLNGYFLERGEISILSKEDKTKIALEYGIDLVIELPLYYGTQSADYFAWANIFLLNSIGVTHLVFGSEQNNLAYLEKMAKKQLDENFKIKKEQKNANYPSLINEALEENSIISPNDLLAISYLKEIIRNNYPIKATPIKRTNDYHDLTSCNPIISASNIREKLKNNLDITSYVPPTIKEKIKTIDYHKLFEFLKLKILTDSALDTYIDVVEGLDYKLKKEIEKSMDYESLLKNLKSKRYTYNRLERMLIHILLGHKKETKKIPITYIHILGFNDKGKNYLKNHKKDFLLPITIDYESKLYKYEIIGAKIYDMITNSTSSSFDILNKPIWKSE